MNSTLAKQEVDSLLTRLDGSGSDDEWSAITELRSRLADQLPDHLLALYRRAKKWAVRSTCVYHSARYAQTSASAVELGLLALRDKSKVVRYRACMVLACSLRQDLLQQLETVLAEVPTDTSADVAAAMDAIKCRNQSYFVDREHSGMITLNVL